MGGLLDLLGGLQEGDLDRPLPVLGLEERATDIPYTLRYLLGGHLEEHFEQLTRLPA